MKTILKIATQCVIFLIFFEILLRAGGATFLVEQEFSNEMVHVDQSHFRILCLGDSLTALGGYPKKLSEILNSEGRSYKFEVFNRGIPGSNSEDAYLLLSKIIDRYKPNMIIAMVPSVDEHAREGQNIANINRIRGNAGSGLLVLKMFHGLFENVRGELEDVAARLHESIQIKVRELNEMKKLLVVRRAALFYRALKVRLKTNDPAQTLYLGMNYAKVGDYGRAMQIFKELDKFPEFLKVRSLEIADLFMDLGQFKLAREWIEHDFSQLQQQESTALYLKFAKCYQHEELKDLASSMYEKALAVSRDEKIIILWTDYLISEGFFEGSEKLLSNVMKQKSALQINGPMFLEVIEKNKDSLIPSWYNSVFFSDDEYNISLYLTLAEHFKKEKLVYLAGLALQQSVSSAKSDINPRILWAKYLISQRLFLQEAEKTLLGVIRNDEVKGNVRFIAYEYLRQCYLLQNKTTEERKVLNELKHLNTHQDEFKGKMYELAKKNKATLVAAQFPMFEIELEKRDYNYVNDIIYVDNKDAFEQAINEYGFREIFRDTIGLYGHFDLTPLIGPLSN